MNRVPKWLLLKEWLSYEDVVKLLDTVPSVLENVLAQDHSEEFGYSFKFLCTFCPRQCKKEFKEYRFESVARQGIRTHLKDHINKLKSTLNKDEINDFLTKNQLYRTSKASKQKPCSKNDANGKKSKRAKRPLNVTAFDEESNESMFTASEPKKSRTHRFTKMKEPIISDDAQESDLHVNEHINDHIPITEPENVQIGDVKLEIQDNENYVKKESVDRELMESEIKSNVDWLDGESNDGINCEIQTDRGGKEQETFQYRLATKLFASDRSVWHNIEEVLDEICAREQPSEPLSQQDRENILRGMRQWIDSVQIYDNQTFSRMHDPLTPAEQNILEHLTIDDWKKLDAGQDPESKLRLTVYARLLLRDYECYPRKLKPKVCRHCNRQYTASTSLYSHLVSLSGIRFWVCSKCKITNKEEATFTRKHSLQYHIMKEVGIPRYRCTQPGCSKTHNHTHHQKSHARQHTGEKHYICEIEGCKGRFSNRNTYSRHLLQFHNVELTRSNQLMEIDEKEARLKVYAARLKARERSKCKRQQGSDSILRISGSSKQCKAQSVPQSGLNEQIVSAAEQFVAESMTSEDISTDVNTSSSTERSLEKFMRPSASQLLYGIARDVRNTTSSLEESRTSDVMMGGLNLLATVSKYMNAEHCMTGNQKNSSMETSNDTNRTSNETQCPGPKTEELSSKNIDMKGRRNAFSCLNENDIASISKIETNNGSERIEQNKDMLKLNVQDANESVKTAFLEKLNGKDIISSANSNKSFCYCCTKESSGNKNDKHENRSSDKVKHVNLAANAKVVPVTTGKLWPLGTSSSNNPQTSKSLRIIQAPFNHFEKDWDTESTPLEIGEISMQQKILACEEMIPCSGSTATEGNLAQTVLTNSMPSLLPPSSATSSTNIALGSVPCLTPGQSGSNTTKLGHSLLFPVQDAKAVTTSPCATKSSVTSFCASLDPTLNSYKSLPGRVIIDASSHSPVKTSKNYEIIPTPVQHPSQTKNIQVIKVANTKVPLQLRSVSSLSGKTYIVLTSSAGQNTSSKAVVSNLAAAGTEKTLSFSKL